MNEEKSSKHAAAEPLKMSRYVTISKAALMRMPAYLRCLQEKADSGEDNVSASEIAKIMSLNPVQVRKDFSEVSSVSGRPKTGFGVGPLISDIEKFLGFDNSTDAVIVGVGKLGRALLGYEGFANYGLNIVAGFDTDTALHGTKCGGKNIFALDNLEHILRRTAIHIGIIAVPVQQAQSVCDKLIAAGVSLVWNFAPVHLRVPQGIVVKNEDMAASLALLSQQLKKPH